MRLTAWEEAALKELVEVLTKYQNYETEDSRDAGRKHSAKLMRGELLPLPKTLFRQIGSLEVQLFKEYADRVVTREMSLSDLVGSIHQMMRRKTTWAVISEALQSSKEEILVNYPGKFKDDIIDQFDGVVLESRNDKKKLLERYLSSVLVKGQDELFVKTVPIEDFKTKMLNNVQTKVFFVSKVDSLFLKEISEHVNIGASVFICNDGEQEDIVNFAKECDLKFYTLYFEVDRESKSKTSIIENCVPVVFVGDCEVKKEVKRCQGKLEDCLESVLKEIVEDRSKIIFYSKGTYLFRIDRSLNVSVVYVGGKSQVKLLEKQFKRRNDTEVGDVIDEESNEEIKLLRDEVKRLKKLVQDRDEELMAGDEERESLKLKNEELQHDLELEFAKELEGNVKIAKGTQTPENVPDSFKNIDYLTPPELEDKFVLSDEDVFIGNKEMDHGSNESKYSGDEYTKYDIQESLPQSVSLLK